MADLNEIQAQIVEWRNRNFGPQEPWTQLMGVVEEVGELAHAHLKGHQGIRGTEDHVAAAQDAVGDIGVYLMSYCDMRGWSMTDLIEKTWGEVRRRDWVTNPDSAHEITKEQAEAAFDALNTVTDVTLSGEFVPGDKT